MSDNKTASPVLRRDERLRRLHWPALRKIDIPNFEDGDCLLACAGFEERSMSVLQKICERQRIDKIPGPTRLAVGLIRYLPEQKQNRIAELRKIAGDLGLQVTEFVYDRENPSNMGEKIRTFVQSNRWKLDGRVYMDISGMSRLLIVQLLVALICSPYRPISVLYAEAMKYPPSQDEYEEGQERERFGHPPSYLSSGIFEIAILPELSSVSMFGEAIRLVAFPSFDPSQLTNLVQELQPTYAELIHGDPPDRMNKWRPEAIRYLNARTLEELHGNVEHRASTLDYRDTLGILFRTYARRSMFDRVLVAPTGSKMQSVAVGLFRAALPDMQIVYPTPKTFNEPEEYTLGFRRLYQLDLPVDAIEDVIDYDKAKYSV